MERNCPLAPNLYCPLASGLPTWIYRHVSLELHLLLSVPNLENEWFNEFSGSVMSVIDSNDPVPFLE